MAGAPQVIFFYLYFPQFQMHPWLSNKTKLKGYIGIQIKALMPYIYRAQTLVFWCGFVGMYHCWLRGCDACYVRMFYPDQKAVDDNNVR